MRTRRSGNVVIVVAAGAMVFVGLLALVIDVGSWYEARARIQTSADMAVLASLGALDPAAAPEVREARVRNVCRRVLLANEVSAEGLELELTSEATSWRLRLRLTEGLPRHFSRGLIEGVQVAVEAHGTRDARGQVALVP